MAIVLRHGMYTDAIKTKLLGGEIGIVTSGDPNSPDGTSIYVSFGNGKVKRFATYEDMAEEVKKAYEEYARDVVIAADKVGTTALNTKSKNLSDAVNEINNYFGKIATNPNNATAMYHFVNGWDTSTVNIPNDAKNKMCILTTIWRYKSSIGVLDAAREQRLTTNEGEEFARTFESGSWTEWRSKEKEVASGNSNLKIIKSGKLVTLFTTGGWFNCNGYTLPSNVRPTSVVYASACALNERATYINIQPNGTMSYGDSGGKGNVLFSVSYLTN